MYIHIYKYKLPCAIPGSENRSVHIYMYTYIYIHTTLGVKGGDSIVFFDWDDGEFIRKIDVSPEIIFWNEAGDAVVLACAESYYVLRFN
jgi:hypothetical protein